MCLCESHVINGVFCFRPKPVGGAIRKKAVRGPIECLPQLMEAFDGNYIVLLQLLEGELDQSQIDQVKSHQFTGDGGWGKRVGAGGVKSLELRGNGLIYVKHSETFRRYLYLNSQ